MILTIQLNQGVDYALSHLIEDVAPAYLPITKLPVHRYHNGHSLAAQLGMTPEKLCEVAAASKVLHAVILPTGAFYLHPDGVEKYISRKMRRLIARRGRAC